MLCLQRGMWKGAAEKIKPHALTLFRRRYGEQRLLDCLEANESAGVVYHRSGITGDYDDFDNVEQLMELIVTGRQ